MLQVLLQDPVATGDRIGGLLDAVTDLERLERTVQRNDEVGWVEKQWLYLHIIPLGGFKVAHFWAAQRRESSYVMTSCHVLVPHVAVLTGCCAVCVPLCPR